MTDDTDTILPMWEQCPNYVSGENVPCDPDVNGVCTTCGWQAIYAEERPADLFDDTEPEETEE